MANKSLFNSTPGQLLPKTDGVNQAGGKAYSFSPKHRLAQYAVTGCLNSVYYAGAQTQLDTVLELTEELDANFIAQTAVYTRTKGYMKDMPALLTAVLANRDSDLFKTTFKRVIDNGKMLRNIVQILRSGAVGRKSLGSAPKRLIQEWLNNKADDTLIRAMVGNSPSLADVIKMVHPKPKNEQRDSLFAYILDKEYKEELLPQELQAFEKYKTAKESYVPDVPFQMLTSLDLKTADWAVIAHNAGWQMTRMNLNTFARHGVFNINGMEQSIANRLRDAEQIRRAKAFPYQLLTAYAASDTGVPGTIRQALHDAMEIALANVPEIKGKVYVLPDVSGSMQSPVTGFRRGSSTHTRCVDAAALFAAAILRSNPQAEILPFDTRVHKNRISAGDGVISNAQKLARFGGGGTDCSLPLRELNRKKAQGDMVIYISDNQSWVDYCYGVGTQTMKEWRIFKKRNPEAKMVCIDIQPYANTQAKDRSDILNIGGFSDQVFHMVHQFASDEFTPEHWVKEIESTRLGIGS